jgi:hypothetical protein
MPKIVIAPEHPLLDIIDADSMSALVRDTKVTAKNKSLARKALAVVADAMRRGFPPGADLSALIRVVDDATLDDAVAEISFQSFDAQTDAYCVYAPNTARASLHRRHATRAVQWTPQGWLRVGDVVDTEREAALTAVCNAVAARMTPAPVEVVEPVVATKEELKVALRKAGDASAKIRIARKIVALSGEKKADPPTAPVVVDPAPVEEPNTGLRYHPEFDSPVAVKLRAAGFRWGYGYYHRLEDKDCKYRSRLMRCPCSIQFFTDGEPELFAEYKGAENRPFVKRIEEITGLAVVVVENDDDTNSWPHAIDLVNDVSLDELFETFDFTSAEDVVSVISQKVFSGQLSINNARMLIAYCCEKDGVARPEPADKSVAHMRRYLDVHNTLRAPNMCGGDPVDAWAAIHAVELGCVTKPVHKGSKFAKIVPERCRDVLGDVPTRAQWYDIEEKAARAKAKPARRKKAA